MAMHPSQPLVVTASADKTAGVQPLALNRGRGLCRSRCGRSSPRPDAARVVVAGDDGVVHVINAGERD